MPHREFSFPSSSGPSVYVTTLAEDGLLSCNCRGWTFRRGTQPRECKHTKEVIQQVKATRSVVGDFIYAEFASPVVETPLAPGLHYNQRVHLPMDGGLTKETTMTMTIPAYPQTDGIPHSMSVSGMTLSGKYNSVFRSVPANYLTKPGEIRCGDGVLDPETFNRFFNNGLWVMDVKLDGHRVIVRKKGSALTTSWKASTLAPQIVAAMRFLPDGVYDGEVHIPGGVSTDVPSISLRTKMTFAIFDVLELMDESVMDLPLFTRRSLLEGFFEDVQEPGLILAPQFEPTLENVQAIWANGGEGAVMKLKSSTYQPGTRTPDWVKVKGLEAHAVTITGYAPGSFGPYAITVVRFDDGTPASIKTKDFLTMKSIEEDPRHFIGRRLVIQCHKRLPGGSPRHPMFGNWESAEWDHEAGIAE